MRHENIFKMKFARRKHILPSNFFYLYLKSVIPVTKTVIQIELTLTKWMARSRDNTKYLKVTDGRHTISLFNKIIQVNYHKCVEANTEKNTHSHTHIQTRAYYVDQSENSIDIESSDCIGFHHSVSTLS